MDRPRPKLFQFEPLETRLMDSVNWSCWLAFPSMVFAPAGVIVKMPVPLFLMVINQPVPTRAAEGSVNVPAPPVHTLRSALLAAERV